MSALNFRLKRNSLFLLIIISCCACNNNESVSKKFKIGFAQAQGGDNWRETMLGEMKREVSFHNNIEFIIKDAQANSKTQKEQIQELINQKIDLLIVSPHEVLPLSPLLEKYIIQIFQ